MPSLDIPSTTEEYAELQRFLDSVKEQSLDRWLEYYRAYAEEDLYFFFRYISSFGSTIHTTYGVPIFDHQIAIDRAKACQYHIANARGLDASGRRSGKALAVDTPILTTTGWKTIGDLAVGDLVFDHDGMPTEVIAKSDVMIGRKCYRVEVSDGTSVVADADHWWVVNTKSRHYGNNACVRLTTEEIAAGALYEKRKDGKLEHALSIPMFFGVNPDASDVELPIDPYVLGLWLGDGNNANNYITIGKQDAEFIVGEMERRGVNPYLLPSYEGKDSGLYGWGKGWALLALRKLNLIHNKHIPDVYKMSSMSQRLDLLRGLMDSDGTAYGVEAGSRKKQRSNASFNNTHRPLVEDFIELARSVGCRPIARERRARLYGKDCGPAWNVTVYHTTDRPAFLLPRKAARSWERRTRRSTWPEWREIPYRLTRQIVAVDEVDSVPVQCIQVGNPAGMFLAGKGLIATHNSELRTSAAPIWFYIHHPNMAATIVSVEKALALRHLRRLKTELESNKMYSVLWPEIFYDDPVEMAKNAGVVWSMSEGLCLKGRTDNRSNQTFEAHAFYGGGPIGSGFDLALVDDAERRDKVSTPEAIEDLDRSFSEMMSLMTPRVVAKPVVLVQNTRFSEAGLIQRIHDRYKAADPKLVFNVPAEIVEEEHEEARKYVHTDELGPLGGEITWPYTADFLRDKLESSPDRTEYALQYAGSYRRANDRAIPESRINWYSIDPKEFAPDCTTYVCVDPSRGAVDPSCFWVWGLRGDKSKIWLDAVTKKLNPAESEFFDELFRLVMMWNALSERTVEIRVEDVGPSTWSELISAELANRGCLIPVVKVRVGVRDAESKFKTRKADRTYARWAPMMNRGEIWFPKPVSKGGRGILCDINKTGDFKDLVQYFLDVELRAFPVSRHDDMLDAGGMIADNKTNAERPLVYGSSYRMDDSDDEFDYGDTTYMSA